MPLEKYLSAEQNVSLADWPLYKGQKLENS